jgi:hypothetical protein
MIMNNQHVEHVAATKTKQNMVEKKKFDVEFAHQLHKNQPLKKAKKKQLHQNAAVLHPPSTRTITSR